MASLRLHIKDIHQEDDKKQSFSTAKTIFTEKDLTSEFFDRFTFLDNFVYWRVLDRGFYFKAVLISSRYGQIITQKCPHQHWDSLEAKDCGQKVANKWWRRS